MTSYYFGCIGGPGHYMWFRDPETMQYQKIWRAVSCPWTPGMIDGCLQPGCGPDVKTWQVTQDQSVGCVHHESGWTALSFWDRSCDERGGSNSTFIFSGTLSFDDAVERAKSEFPEIYTRMSVLAPLREFKVD